MRFNKSLGMLLVVMSAFLHPCLAATNTQSFTPQQVHQDIDSIVAGIRATHPDISHSVGPAEFESAVRSLRKRIDRDLTRDEVWRELATLNPVLADGHLFVGYSSWRDETALHLKEGGALFPFEVAVSENGKVHIVAELGGQASKSVGNEIDSINGIRASKVVRELLSRVHGDTPRFRAKLLSQRWWFFYWKVYGAPSTYDLKLKTKSVSVLQRKGSTEKPAVLVGEDTFDHQFQFEVKADRSAVMTINTFSWSDLDAFYEFTRRSFEQMKAAGTQTLIIDVRNNGGGDDAMWLEGMLPYLADKPYRWASRYIKKVVKADPAKNERLGDVVEGNIDRWIAPVPDNPLHFSGQVYVLVGPATYSSAILFANTMQDFGFSLIAGTGGSARSKQSGGVQKIALSNTGLALWTPRFLLTRPSGSAVPYYLEPDLEVEDSAFSPSMAVDAVLQKSIAKSSAKTANERQ